MPHLWHRVFHEVSRAAGPSQQAGRLHPPWQGGLPRIDWFFSVVANKWLGSRARARSRLKGGLQPGLAAPRMSSLAKSCQGARTFGQGDGAGAHAMGDGASPFAVDFDGDGTLQQADGDDQAVNLVRVGDDTFQTRQRAAFDVHLRADGETPPRLRRKAGTKDRTNGLDLVEVDGDGDLAGTDDTDHAGRGQDGQAIIHIELAEQVTREERERSEE